MISYTTLTSGGKTRLLRTHETSSTVVTTIADPNTATKVAEALTLAACDIPNAWTWHIAEQLDLDFDVTDQYYSSAFDESWLGDWEDLELPAESYDLKRRVLNAYDAGPDADPAPGALWTVTRLRAELAGQPPSVIRAVRDELVDRYAPYTGTPVLALAYDHKWTDLWHVFLANGSLAELTDDELAKLQPYDCNELLYAGHRAGLGDYSYADQAAENGYLRVCVNKGQYQAWLAAHQKATAAH